MRGLEPGLQDELGSHGIKQRLGGFAVATGLAQPGFGIERSQPLVGIGNRQVETALQTLTELGGEPGHFVRRTIGMRVPSHPLALALLAELDEPLMSVTLILPGETEPMEDPYEIRDALEKQVDLIIDGGFGGHKASTVISLVDDEPQVVRVGCGDPTPFMVEA